MYKRTNKGGLGEKKCTNNGGLGDKNTFIVQIVNQPMAGKTIQLTNTGIFKSYISI